MAERFIEPVTLHGRHATLEPLAPAHLDEIRAAASDGELWRLWYTSVPAPERAPAWLAATLEMREKQGALPFVVITLYAGLVRLHDGPATVSESGGSRKCETQELMRSSTAPRTPSSS